MSRHRIAALLAFCAAASAGAPALAQDGARGSPPERIDITVPAPPAMSSTEEACARQREAAVISGEIVVCGSQTGGTNPRYSSNEEAENRYAAKTAFRDDPATPDVAGKGIFRGPATVSGICVPGLFNCPRPPAVFVDVTALPKAPPGSDADRIARGLEPLGEDAATPPGTPNAQQRAELGLPPPSPGESAAPAAPR